MIPGFKTLEAIARAAASCCAELVWLYQDTMPPGKGLYLDLVCSDDLPKDNSFPKINLDVWYRRLSARYQLPILLATRIVDWVAYQYHLIFSRSYFDVFFAWNTCEPCMGVGRVVADVYNIPVISFETGLFNGNLRVDYSHFHDPRNQLPPDGELEKYGVFGSSVLELIKGKLKASCERSSRPRRFQGFSRKCVSIALLDSLFSDNGSDVTASDSRGVFWGGLSDLAVRLSDRCPSFRVHLRPHPLLRSKGRYRNGTVRRFLQKDESLEELVRRSDICISNFSKVGLHCLLLNKPSFCLGQDFLFDALPRISSQVLFDPAKINQLLSEFDIGSCLQRVSRVVGFLVAERWPSLDSVGLSSKCSIMAIVKDILDRHRPIVDVGEKVLMLAWVSLAESSHARLSAANEIFRRRLRRFSSRKVLVTLICDRILGKAQTDSAASFGS